MTHKAALIILIILGVQINSAANYEVDSSADEAYYHQYCTEFSKKSPDKANNYAETEMARFKELHENPNTSADELRPETGFMRAYEQLQYINSLEIENKAMFYQTGFQRVFGVSSLGYSEEIRLTLVAALGICLAISSLIAYDNRRQLGHLLFTNKRGKIAYFRDNITASAIASVLISIAVNIPHIIGILCLYKTNGIEFSIKCIKEFEFFPNISIGAYIVLLCFFRALILTLCGWAVLFISSKCKNVSDALLISLAIFALPEMLYLVGMEFALMLCMPFSVNCQIVECAWVYTAIVVFVCLVLAIYLPITKLKTRT